MISIRPQTTATTATDNNNLLQEDVCSVMRISCVLECSKCGSSFKHCHCSLLNCSVDSGISGISGMEDLKCHNNNEKLIQQLEQYRRILSSLEKDRNRYSSLREKLSKIIGHDDEKRDVLCNVCFAKLNLKQLGSFERCFSCAKYICRESKCGKWHSENAFWECRLCHSSKTSLAQTSSWVADQISYNERRMIFPLRARSEIFIPINDYNERHFGSVTDLRKNEQILSLDQKLKIREYVEELVSKLVGGSLNHIRIAELSKSESCLPQIKNVENSKKEGSPPIEDKRDLAQISHDTLRKLIETIILETLHDKSSSRLTTASNSSFELRTRSRGSNKRTHQTKRFRTEQFFQPKNYHDLLATAVLNKIIDDDGNVILADGARSNDADSNFNSEQQSLRSTSSADQISYSEADPDERAPPVLTSLTPFSVQHHENTFIDTERNSILSDYIGFHHGHDLSTATVSENEEDDYASVESSALGEGTWEDNWSFRKKRSPVPSTLNASTLSMLVPAPQDDVKAKIGDKTTDEISDLSEIGSEDEDLISQTNLNDRLLNKKLIGGENQRILLDELFESAKKDSKLLESDEKLLSNETTNDKVKVPLDDAKKSLKDLEQIVDVNILPPPEEFEDTSLTQVNDEEQKDLICNGTQSKADSEKAESEISMQNHISLGSKDSDKACSENHKALGIQNTPNLETKNNVVLNGFGPQSDNTKESANKGSQSNDPNEALDETIFTKQYKAGSIAEREYKKWNNAVEMPNNPYAPEALKRRLSGKEERLLDIPYISPSTEQNTLPVIPKEDPDLPTEANIDIKRFSRDYYINEQGSEECVNEKMLESSPKSQERCRSLQTLHHISPHDKSVIPNQSSYHKVQNDHVRNPIYLEAFNSYYDDSRSDILCQPSMRNTSWNTLPSRRAASTLGFNDNESTASLKPTKLRESNILTQFEKQLLHKDFKRNSLQALCDTTKDFVKNPLFDDKEKFL